jgi:hypothetical protein
MVSNVEKNILTFPQFGNEDHLVGSKRKNIEI